MFSFSSALISVASENRGGGWVKCWVGVRSWRSSAMPDAEGRQERIFLLAGRGEDPAVAVELEDLALGLEDPLAGPDRTLVTAKTAGVIWLATNRR